MDAFSEVLNGVLGPLAALDAPLPRIGADAGARRVAHVDLSLRRGWLSPRLSRRRARGRGIARRHRALSARDPHRLSSGSGSNQLDGASLLRKVATKDLSPMRAGGGGAMTGFVCGYLTCDPLLCGPILESLPPLLKVNIRTDRSGLWLEAPRARRGEFDRHRGTAARNLDVDVQITDRKAVHGIVGADDEPHRLPCHRPE